MQAARVRIPHAARAETAVPRGGRQTRITGALRAYLARDSHCAWLGARRERGGRGTGTAMPDDHARAGTRSEGTEKRDELLLLVGAELGEAIARGAPLAVVRENRVLDSGRSPVVQEGGEKAETPERGRTHLGSRRLSLLDAVAETAHVVEQAVGVRLEGTCTKGRDLTLAGLARAHVTASGYDLREAEDTRRAA